MSEVIEGSPPPRIIRDWRDWLNELPKVAALALFCLVAWIAMALMVHGLVLWSLAQDTEVKESVIRLLGDWRQDLLGLTAASVVAIVGKRATEKPEVIRAEGEVKAAVVKAAAQTGTHPVQLATSERGADE